MVKQIDKRTDRISKRTKKLVTVDNILTKDSVAEAVQKIIKAQSEMIDMICVYRDQDGTPCWILTRRSEESQITYMLLRVLLCLLLPQEKEEE